MTYVFILSWGEWWQYVLGAGAMALSASSSPRCWRAMPPAGREDATMLKLARYLTIGQLAGMVIAMIGLIADAKMPRDPQEARLGGERDLLLRRGSARGDQRERPAADRSSRKT